MLEKLFIFAKAQISAFVGGIVDYFVMILFTEVFHVHYTISIAIGGIIGAIVNFSVNKKWTFHSKHAPYKSSTRWQLIRFVIVVINSIFMKSYGTYLITTFVHIDYKISRILVDLVVSTFINYNLQKHWVFRKHKKLLNQEIIN